LPSEIRYLAIIQLKNGIDKYWRRAGSYSIQAEEKAEIRSRLIDGGFEEAETSLALQNALVVSKVVRIEYPVDWPDALPTLIQRIRGANESNQTRLRRGMLMLLQVAKELATARLRKSRTTLQSMTPEIVYLLNQIYTQKVSIWTAFLAGNGDDEGGAIEAMENSLFAIKVLRRLLIVGYEHPYHDKDAQQLWEHSQHQFGQFLAMISQEPPVLVTPAKELVEKHLAQLSKLHGQMATEHPAGFGLLPNSLELTRAYWGLVSKFGESYGSETQDFSAKALRTDDGTKTERPVMEKLCIKGLGIIRACLKTAFGHTYSFKYRSDAVKEEHKHAVSLIKSQLLTDGLVAEIANVIVTKFFVFRQVDLEAWEEDEDEWEIREEGGGDTWEFEVRPCSEKLFMDLVLNFRNLLVPPLLSFFQSVAGSGDISIVTKDAVYTAMGLSAPVVYEIFDFGAFLKSTLVNDVQQVGPGYKVLRRRIAILIGQWVTIKIPEADRPLVYQIFQHLLNSGDSTNDQVVRVTAARQLKHVIDDVGFDSNTFQPYAPDTISRLLALIQEVENTETKMAILETVRVIAIRLEQQIISYSDQIVSILPNLWEASGEEHLLKQAILTLLSTLVAALKDEACRYHSLILPLIQRAVEHGSEMQVYLLEEALDLWSTILAQTPSPGSADVLGLAEYAFALLEIGSDSLRVVLKIVESYVLLAPELLLGDATRLRVLSFMTNLLGVTKRELAGQVTVIVENMIRAAESLGGSNGVSLIVKDLQECGYLEKILEGLRDAWEAHQTSGPNRKYPELDDVVETDYFTILARIALADPTIFVNMLASAGQVGAVWDWISAEWFAHFDSMANIERQKLSCLALTRMLELPPPAIQLILPKLQDYFAMWSTVISEMIAGRDDGVDNLVWAPITNEDKFGDHGVMRERVHSHADPVHNIDAWAFVKERLANLVQAVGGEEPFQREWLVNVDADVLAGYQGLGVVRDVN